MQTQTVVEEKDSANTSFPYVFKDSTKGLPIAFAFVVFKVEMQIQ